MRSLIALMLMILSLTTFADSRSFDVPENAKWKAECGSCHLAFPPAFLSKGDWKELMQKLDKHFGADASLEEVEQKEIAQFLQRYGAQGRQYSARSHRISETGWFKHEHDEVSARTWKDPLVNSPANCVACHLNAARGDWSEHGIHMPGKYGIGKDDEDDN